MTPPFNKVEIEVIPHEKQRYATCGDWRIVHGVGDEKILLISVSKVDDWRCWFAVAVHELFEAGCCFANGITQEQVDKFDMDYEAKREVHTSPSGQWKATVSPTIYDEPGDDPKAPYFVQHGLATSMERMLTTQMQLPWPDHEAMITELFETKPTPRHE